MPKRSEIAEIETDLAKISAARYSAHELEFAIRGLIRRGLPEDMSQDMLVHLGRVHEGLRLSTYYLAEIRNGRTLYPKGGGDET